MANSTASIGTAPDAHHDAFRALVERTSAQLFRIAWRITGDEATAEDVVQDTYLRAFRRWHQFDGRARPETWLYRIAVNAALDAVRRDRRGLALLNAAEERVGSPDVAAGAVAEPSPHRRLEAAELFRNLRGLLAELSPMERVAFTRRHVEGASIDEIAHALGVRRGAGKQAVFRAVRKLRRSLAPLVGTAERSP